MYTYYYKRLNTDFGASNLSDFKYPLSKLYVPEGLNTDGILKRIEEQLKADKPAFIEGYYIAWRENFPDVHLFFKVETKITGVE